VADGSRHRASERGANRAEPTFRRVRPRAQRPALVWPRAQALFYGGSVCLFSPIPHQNVDFALNIAIPYRERLIMICESDQDSSPTPQCPISATCG
jgi:hypothetical protein